MVVFDHVSPYVTRKTLSLDRFQEFVIVLMKLRLNMPLQDLAYRFMVSHSTVSWIFSSWLVVMDTRLYFVSTSQRIQNTANRQISLFGEGLARTNPNIT